METNTVTNMETNEDTIEPKQDTIEPKQGININTIDTDKKKGKQSNIEKVELLFKPDIEGYSDFVNMGTSNSFNFSNTTTSNPITHGANALKLENEIVQEQQQEQLNSNVTNEEVMQSNNIETASVVEDTSVNEMEKSFTQEAIESSNEQIVDEKVEEDVSNDLKEFGVDTDAPDLFSSDTENSSSENLLSSSDNEEDDDLEIPAFLRRQKN